VGVPLLALLDPLEPVPRLLEELPRSAPDVGPELHPRLGRQRQRHHRAHRGPEEEEAQVTQQSLARGVARHPHPVEQPVGVQVEVQIGPEASPQAGPVPRQMGVEVPLGQPPRDVRDRHVVLLCERVGTAEPSGTPRGKGGQPCLPTTRYANAGPASERGERRSTTPRTPRRRSCSPGNAYDSSWIRRASWRTVPSPTPPTPSCPRTGSSAGWGRSPAARWRSWPTTPR